MMNYMSRVFKAFLAWVRTPILAKPVLTVGEEGFRLEYKQKPFRPNEKRVLWADVSEIHARMDDVLSLIFVDSAGKTTLVDETMDSWFEFLATVLERFPEFDMDKFREVEAYFKLRMSYHQLCWSRENT